MNAQRQHIHCIVPAYILEQIARNGSPQQRAQAIDTLAVDQTFRAARLQNTPPGGARSRVSDVLALGAGPEARAG